MTFIDEFTLAFPKLANYAVEVLIEDSNLSLQIKRNLRFLGKYKGNTELPYNFINVLL